MNIHFSKKRLTTAFLMALTVTVPFASANIAASSQPLSEGETLIPVGSQVAQPRGAATPPIHGQTMTDVLQNLGTPEKSDTVGKPAISRWFYPERNMTVYFEDKKVLHTVVRQSP